VLLPALARALAALPVSATPAAAAVAVAAAIASAASASAAAASGAGATGAGTGSGATDGGAAFYLDDVPALSALARGGSGGSARAPADAELLLLAAAAGRAGTAAAEWAGASGTRSARAAAAALAAAADSAGATAAVAAGLFTRTSPAAPAANASEPPTPVTLFLTALGAALLSDSLNLAHTPALRSLRALPACVPALLSLDVSACALTTLAGVEGLPALRELNAADNAVTDLTPLSGLRYLHALDVSRNRPASVAASAAGANVATAAGPALSLAPLSALPALAALACERAGVSTLAPLSALKTLTALHAGGNSRLDPRTEVAHLAALPRLEILDIAPVVAPTASPLSAGAAVPVTAAAAALAGEDRLWVVYSLPRLRVLDGTVVDAAQTAAAREAFTGRVTETVLMSALGLIAPAAASSFAAAAAAAVAGSGAIAAAPGASLASALRSLTSLDLSGRKLRSVSLITGAACPQLRTLILDDNHIADFTSLRAIPSLRVLRLNRNRITGALATANSGGVATGDGSNAPPAGAPALARLYPQLEVLELSHNRLVSVADLNLGGLTSLVALGLEANQIKRVCGLASLSSLQHLVLSGNRVHRLDPDSFAGATALRELQMENCGLRTLQGFGHHPALLALFLAGNRVTDLGEIDALIPPLPPTLPPPPAYDPLTGAPVDPVVWAAQHAHQQAVAAAALAATPPRGCPQLAEIALKGNPIARKQLYRQSLVHRLPSLRIIDALEITLEERERVAAYFMPATAPLLSLQHMVPDGAGGWVPVPQQQPAGYYGQATGAGAGGGGTIISYTAAPGGGAGGGGGGGGGGLLGVSGAGLTAFPMQLPTRMGGSLAGGGGAGGVGTGSNVLPPGVGVGGLTSAQLVLLQQVRDGAFGAGAANGYRAQFPGQFTPQVSTGAGGGGSSGAPPGQLAVGPGAVLGVAGHRVGAAQGPSIHRVGSLPGGGGGAAGGAAGGVVGLGVMGAGYGGARGAPGPAPTGSGGYGQERVAVRAQQFQMGLGFTGADPLAPPTRMQPPRR
jgi:Leucine-rich repeat (LRR) protein